MSGLWMENDIADAMRHRASEREEFFHLLNHGGNYIDAIRAERDSALESRRILESRYSALEKAGRACFDAFTPFITAWELKEPNGPLDGEQLHAQLGALLDSEASDQGVSDG